MHSAFTFNLRRCQLLGWWRIKTNSVSKQFIYRLYSLISLFWLGLFAALQVIDLYDASSALDTFSTNLCGTSVSVASLVKTFSVMARADSVEYLKESFLRNLYIPHVGLVETDRKIVIRAGREMVKLTNIFFGLVIPTVFGWSVMPLIDKSEGKRLPMRLWIPINWSSTPAYELFYVYQVVGLWLFAINIVSQDLTFFGFIIQLCSQYEILEKNLKMLNKLLEKPTLTQVKGKIEKELVEAIRRNIMHHQEILRTIKIVQFVYNESLFIHFSGAVPLVCVIGFNIISAGKSSGMNTLMISQIGYIGSTLFDIFFFCSFGDQLKEKGSRISRAIYEIKWYKMRCASRKPLIVIMARAQNSPGLNFGRMMPINMQSFLQILRNSYNIVAVMDQMSNVQSISNL